MMTYTPGQRLFLRRDLGDAIQGKRVVVPRGQPGIYRGIGPATDLPNHPLRAFIDVPDSPGQKVLTCLPNEIHIFWATHLPLNAWEIIVLDDPLLA